MSAAIQPYTLLDDEDCESRILEARETLAERLVILGHHYQRDEVFRHADFTGDSLKLSRQAAASKADYIVFCGVWQRWRIFCHVLTRL
jgi:quinolinate synthase